MTDITEPKIGPYQHYKGGFYTVVGVATHSEDLSKLVVYRSEKDNNNLWVRPLKMFMEDVTIKGITQPRFKYLG